MKGPSLDAIRKFKLLQEKKKKEEEDKKVQIKLSTLEHRASQGDRKAKALFKKFTEKPPPPPPTPASNSNRPSPVAAQTKNEQPKVKPPKKETSFQELMNLAKQNKNNIGAPAPKVKPPPPLKILKPPPKMPSQPTKAPPHQPQKVKPHPSIVKTPSHVVKTQPPVVKHQASTVKHQPSSIRPPPLRVKPVSRPPVFSKPPPEPHTHVFSYNNRRHLDEYDDYEDEDEYESDGFVVDEEEDEEQNNVSQTIRSLFRYDKRRCDLREQELDRQYRAIGKVSTFEDLEREERRASRIAAAEDARALREEEEKKRKKMALKQRK